MCPEKERYLREYGKQLSIFEVLAGSDSRADHDRMVKEYSRSSADQEEPLAHELRPSRVLRTAMNYLLSNIVNLLSSAVQRDGGSNGNGKFDLHDSNFESGTDKSNSNSHVMSLAYVHRLETNREFRCVPQLESQYW